MTVALTPPGMAVPEIFAPPGGTTRVNGLVTFGVIRKDSLITAVLLQCQLLLFILRLKESPSKEAFQALHI